MFTKRRMGFTIVELLIVIVVIAILATISVVAYNSIQNRARNTRTIQAVAAWAKAIKLYNVDNGTWPAPGTCLGDIDSYDGDGMCWSNGIVVNAGVVSALKKYMGGGAPVPDLTLIQSTSSVLIRGARYDNGNNSIFYVLSGTNECPSVSGINQTYRAVYTGGVQCGGALQ